MSLVRARFVRLALVVLAIGLVAASCGRDVEAVSIGGQSLTRAELDDMLDAQFPESADGNHDIGAAAGFLSNFIFGEAIAAELADRGFPVTESALVESAISLAASTPDFDPESAEGAAAIRFGAIETVFDEWITANLPDVDIEPPEYMCASHILVENEEEALVVGDRLAEGEAFADLAVEVSVGPSGPGGGDLGCAPTAGYVAEFVDGAREVEPVGVTGPVQTQFGWHVIEVRSFGPLSADVHPEIDPATVDGELAAARTQAEQESVGPIVDELRDAAFARVDRELELDERYGTWDGNAGVVPPDGVTEG